MVDRDNRPSPEALLAEAKYETRGRLKIFLGASPGVGKTYAMLQAAQERRRDQVDVVIGVVETHGRKETEQLVDGLERIPLKKVDYRGRIFEEMDIEAIIARRPAIVLVDELAHTNVPGSRHLKRYQDVEDILMAGINVYSTLNIQHLESLNDVVERITNIKVRETLPDSVLADADEIELIDLSPEDLLKRMAEGKVYVPEQARKAAQNFFSPGNLTALREMALRHAAERVDAQMVNYMRAHAIAGPWPARERILVCVGDDSAGVKLIRVAKRVAERRDAPWVAVYVETHSHLSLSEQDKDRIDHAMRLAEQLGAETVTLYGDDVAVEILTYAKEHNCTQLVVGRTRKRGWRLLAGSSTTDKLLARCSAYDVLLIGGDDTEQHATDIKRRDVKEPTNWWYYILSGFGVAVATFIGSFIYRFLPIANISVGFLILVMLVAMRLGRGPAIFASVGSFLSFNFFFGESRFVFSLTDTHFILTIFFFLAAAILVSNLASRVRVQVKALKLSARRTSNLYEFSRKIAAAVTKDDVFWAVVHHVAATIHGKSLILQNIDGSLQIAAGYPPEDQIGDKDAAAADWAWANGHPAGRGSSTLPTADWLFLPLKTAHGPVGVLGIQMDGQDFLGPDESRLLEALADQAAVSIERTSLVADVEAARLATETGRLRSVLLSSLSHDLRTPLTSILHSATELIDDQTKLSANDRLELSQAIMDEAEKLSRFVQNLLDMTKLESGALKPKVDWVELREVVNSALDRTRKLLKRRQVRIDIDPKLPMICIDPVQFEQVFFNLIDNACKYSPPGSTLTIWSRAKEKQILIEVCDQGAGIPEADRESVFDMFHRVSNSDDQTTGVGLGLAICRGIVEAHGGTIKAAPGLNGAGACIVLALPRHEQQTGEIPSVDEKI